MSSDSFSNGSWSRWFRMGNLYINIWDVRHSTMAFAESEIRLFCAKYYTYSSKNITAIWKLGWPTGLQVSLEVWGFVLSVLFAGWIGTNSQAAHAIVLNPVSVSNGSYQDFLSAATRVGKMIGYWW